MSNIEENLAFILSSRYGEDVRQAIHDAIHDCYEDGKAGAVDLIAREQIADTDGKLSAQIANLVANAPSGSEKDSELVDIRVGYEGTTYKSAGEAVRGQVGKLSEEIEEVIFIKKIIENTDGHFFYSNFFKVGHTYIIKNQSPSGAINMHTTNNKQVINNEYVETITTYLNHGATIEFTPAYEASYIHVYYNSSVENILYIEDTNRRMFESEKEIELLREKNNQLNAELNLKLTRDVGKNIFNINTENKLVGTFAYYASGVIQNNSDFTAYVVDDVKPGEILSFNVGSIHVCAVSVVPDLTSMTVEDKLDGYISGFADSAPKQGYIVPDGTKCLVVSTNKDNTQIEKGDETTHYEGYKAGLKLDKILGIHKIYVGKGEQYETIQEAVNNASDGDTIIVMPGIYKECVDARTKFVNIKGFSRDSCVLTYDRGHYDYPPLEMAKGVVENMTIIETATKKEEDSDFLAYCVHIDFSEERDNSLQFKNCRFHNTIRECVGIGLRNNYRLSFINCEFETDDGHCAYVHEGQSDNISGQYVEFIDCSFKRNSSGIVILMQETPALLNNSATIRFQRNILTNLGGEKIAMRQYGTQPGLTGEGYLGSTNWLLDTASLLNSDDLLNA